MSFMANLWLVGYSVAFVVYGGALAREVSGARSSSRRTLKGGTEGMNAGTRVVLQADNRVIMTVLNLVSGVNPIL